MLTRREIIRAGGAGALTLGMSSRIAEAALPLSPDLPSGTREEAVLEALPGKKPLIKLSYRPPNYEAPLEYLETTFTLNDQFFVRYHLADIPEVDAANWRLRIGGEAASDTLELGLDALRRGFENVEVAAVCQCSGSRRGLFQPHVPGVQWGVGAIGNARWKGVRLRDVLGKVGLKKEAVEIVADGADSAVVDKTPDFVKSIPVSKALDEHTIIAFEMNGEKLPHWNGFPARLVVPGWTATYWMKHLTRLEAVAKPFEGFWVKSAYRIPRDKFPVVERFLTQETQANTPITEMMVNSLATSPRPGQRFEGGETVTVKGIAWDGGYGIREVEVSSDGGQSWRPAKLGEDHGRFSFRDFSYALSLPAGKHTLAIRAANRVGQSQTTQLIHNPAGYHHNVIQRIDITVA
jgi:DMSO/TMAO reductase YedYZ molybdopterin-dependent catalytic subunit